MSSAPKRSHEETSHPTTSKRSVEEGGVLLNNTGKPSQPSIGHCSLSLEPGPDGRAAKVQRTEQRDVDKRSSLLPLYRISSSANGSSPDHPVASESRTELRDSKESRDVKSDARETETNTRELIADPRIDPAVNKAEKDLKQENKGEDKVLKPDREGHSDFKTDSRSEKEGVGGSSLHVGWKDSKEHQRNKRYSEEVRKEVSHSTEEVRKEVLTGEERETFEAQEVVGENRLDLKGDERLKDKERKKKDEKHREWGEKDKERSDRRNSLKPPGNSSKDFTREDRETERWERERKDTSRDKERKDKEKDNLKRETLNTNEKDILLNEKEAVEVSAKIPDQEGTSLESKKTGDFDASKGVDRDVKDKKREKDPDSEVDRNEKRRYYEKESEDSFAEGATEREREVFGYGIQQRRRMLRPRATHSSNREPRFRTRARENDG